ncbi:hypothetical protein GC197_06870 [bacterium]|nr:hypothetical protein [bacterium]
MVVDMRGVVGLSRWFLVSIVLVFTAEVISLPVALGSCEPEENGGREGLKQLVGPIDEKPNLTDAEKEAAAKKRAEDERERLMRERLDAEAKKLTNQLQTSLDNIKLWEARARIRTKLGRRESAISDWTEVLKLKPSSDVLAKRGDLWSSLNEFEKAEADLNEAVQMEPENPEILYIRGKVYLEQWKTGPAFNDFSKVIEIDPQHKMARFQRAYLLMGVATTNANQRAAAKDLKIVVDADPDWLAARYHYVRALSGYEESARELVKHASYVLWHDPDSDCMHMYRAKAYAQLKQFDLALKDANDYMEANPRDPLRVTVRAIVYTDMENHEKAIGDWTTRLKYKHDSELALYNRAKSYGAIGHHQEGIDDWTRLIELDPKNHKWNRLRAFAKEKQHDYAGALEDMTIAIQKAPMGSQLYGNRAFIYDQIGEHAKARAEREKAELISATWSGERKKRKLELQQAEEKAKQELTPHVAEQIEKLKQDQKWEWKAMKLHCKSQAWGPIWLDSLTKLLADPDEKNQARALNGIQTLIDNNNLYPFTPELTQRTVDTLQQFAQQKQKQNQRMGNRAKTIAKVLKVLQKINDPETTIFEPGGIYFRKFTYPKDEAGRPGEFVYFAFSWYEEKKGADRMHFRETRRTPEYIELFDIKRALYVRLYSDKAFWSFTKEKWILIGEGKTS